MRIGGRGERERERESEIGRGERRRMMRRISGVHDAFGYLCSVLSSPSSHVDHPLDFLSFLVYSYLFAFY